MVRVQITVDSSKMQNISQHLPQIRKKGLNYSAQGMLRHLKMNSPVDHGLLKSWFFENFITTCGGKTDVIGMSYYPYWTGGDEIENVAFNLNDKAMRRR